MIQRRLGGLDADIAPLGLGCFGLSHAYGTADPEEAIGTIHHALELGCRLLDTADLYGAGENERLVGMAVRDRRNRVVLASKVGFTWDAGGRVIGRNGSAEYIRSACEASLNRLGTDVIDLYTLHRVDPEVPIEESVGAMSQLVVEGKVRALGLSEVTATELRRARAVHPISALQSEYSLWNRDPEVEMIPLCREFGIAFIAFSPLGRGLFSGTVNAASFTENDFRRGLPRFEANRLRATLPLIDELTTFATRANLTPSQVALSWILHKGENIFAIPGTRRPMHLEENFAALAVRWTPQQLNELDGLFPADLDFGARYSPGSSFAPTQLIYPDTKG